MPNASAARYPARLCSAGSATNGRYGTSCSSPSARHVRPPSVTVSTVPPSAGASKCPAMTRSASSIMRLGAGWFSAIATPWLGVVNPRQVTLAPGPRASTVRQVRPVSKVASSAAPPDVPPPSMTVPLAGLVITAGSERCSRVPDRRLPALPA